VGCYVDGRLKMGKIVYSEMSKLARVTSHNSEDLNCTAAEAWNVAMWTDPYSVTASMLAQVLVEFCTGVCSILQAQGIQDLY
jgi:hypothetical protein